MDVAPARTRSDLAVDPGLSLYLDLLRAVGALLVLVCHISRGEFIGHHDSRIDFPAIGRDGVIIFFALSGFVIRHAALTRDRSLPAFAAARASRLLPVAIPAILVADALGMGWQAPHWWRHLPLQMTLTSQWWFERSDPINNVPFWSLSYEAAYYALFACAVFLKGRVRLAALAVVALLVGPKVLILLPAWLLGVAVHRLGGIRMRRGAAVLLFVATLALYVGLRAAGLERPLAAFGQHLLGGPGERFGYSVFFPSYAVFGTLVAINIFAAARVGLAVPGWLVRPIRIGADLSFALYLFHWPVLRAASPWVRAVVPDALPRALVLIALAVLLSYPVARATDWAKIRMRRGLVRRGPAPLPAGLAGAG